MAPPDSPKLLPPNLPISGTKIKRVITRWIGLLIIEDDGCSLAFAKVTNPNIIKGVDKSPYISHPPNESDGISG